MEWVKIRCDILDNRKIKPLRMGPDGNNRFTLWVTVIIEAEHAIGAVDLVK